MGTNVAQLTEKEPYVQRLNILIPANPGLSPRPQPFAACSLTLSASTAWLKASTMQNSLRKTNAQGYKTLN